MGFSKEDSERGRKPGSVMASADLTWWIIRNNSSSLLKRSRLNMSLEADNLKSKGMRRPGKNITRLELKRDPRRTIATIRSSLRANNYRKALINPAVRKTCALLKSQKPVVMKRARGGKK